jgi:hypothetical protein
MRNNTKQTRFNANRTRYNVKQMRNNAKRTRYNVKLKGVIT